MDLTTDKCNLSVVSILKDSIARTLHFSLPKGQSAFLWGPRKTGKTTWIEQHFPKSTSYNLLETDVFLRFAKEPFRLREEIALLLDQQNLVQPVILDEIQKIPALLDEVHSMIEKKKISFILCGSSARKLKRSHANMLGGRAWRFELHSLTSLEIGKNFDLLRALNQGLIPSHYLASSQGAGRFLKAYIQDYLREEIQQEGLVRNLPAFARFLDSMAFSNGEMINYANIGNDCSVGAKTVKEYYQILEDTLLGTFLVPFRKKRKRQIISATPKFYLFDVGIAAALTHRRLEIKKGAEFGKAFEHFIFMELLAYRSYSEKNIPIRYWRTKDGYEVDFVIEEPLIAIEVKSNDQVTGQDLKGLHAFMEEHKPKKAFVVCQEKVPRKIENGIEVLPWRHFLEKLWAGGLF